MTNASKTSGHFVGSVKQSAGEVVGSNDMASSGKAQTTTEGYVSGSMGSVKGTMNCVAGVVMGDSTQQTTATYYVKGMTNSVAGAVVGDSAQQTTGKSPLCHAIHIYLSHFRYTVTKFDASNRFSKCNFSVTNITQTAGTSMHSVAGVVMGNFVQKTSGIVQQEKGTQRIR